MGSLKEIRRCSKSPGGHPVKFRQGPCVDIVFSPFLLRLSPFLLRPYPSLRLALATGIQALAPFIQSWPNGPC